MSGFTIARISFTVAAIAVYAVVAASAQPAANTNTLLVPAQTYTFTSDQSAISGERLAILNKVLTDVRRVSSEGESAPLVKKIQAFSSPARDNTPIISADGTVMFFNSTRRDTRRWARYDSVSNRYDEDIYFSVFVGPGESPGEEIWSQPKNLGREINSSMDDGVSAISPDGHTIYYNSLKLGWETDGGPFYRAQLHGTQWQNAEGLGGGITAFFANRDKHVRFRVYGASVSADGKEFFFATSVQSPSNQLQIWVSHFSNGEWGYPENLGSNINGFNGSYAPYIAADGKTLYFAARGNDGESTGNDEIYVSVLRNGQWQKAVNVGAPINTPGDESFMSVPASGDRLYLSSAQNGDDDIYIVSPLPRKLRPLSVVMVTGTITDAKTGKPIEGSIALEDLNTGEIIQGSTSDSASGKYTVILQPGHEYGVAVTAPGYVFYSDHYTVASGSSYKRYERNFQLDKPKPGKAFIANNVFFGYDSASIRPVSYPELDRISMMMNEHPEATILITGHTDNVGSDIYNVTLSNLRAEAVKEYMVDVGGIVASRIKTRGYGARKPIAPNDTELGRQRNRRTEFTFLKMIVVQEN